MIFGIIIIILFIILLWLVFKCYRMLRRIFWLIIKKYIIHLCLSRFKKDHNKKCESGKCLNIRESIRELLKENNIEVTEKELDYLIDSVYK